MRTTLKRLSIAWLLFVPLAALFQALTYSGLYRWLCEWQLASGGEYDAVLTALTPTLLLIIPAVMFLRSQLPDKPPVTGTSPDQRALERRGMRIIATVGLGAAAICLALLLWAWHLPARRGPSVTVDLATLGHAAPPLGRVTLVGAIDADHITRKLRIGKGSIDNERNLYAPMLVSGAPRGTGRIFVDQYVGDGMVRPLPTDGVDHFTGVLIEGGLPVDMERQFARIGVRLTNPYYVLRTGPDGDRGRYYVPAMLSGFLAALTLIPLALILLARRSSGAGGRPDRR